MSESNERESILGIAPVKGLLSIFLILITLACSIVAVFSFVIVLILAPTPEDFKDFFNWPMIGTGGEAAIFAPVQYMGPPLLWLPYSAKRSVACFSNVEAVIVNRVAIEMLDPMVSPPTDVSIRLL